MAECIYYLVNTLNGPGKDVWKLLELRINAHGFGVK